MITHIFLAAALLCLLFIIFLVISKATGNIDNALYKLEYMLRKECDVRLEALELKYKIKSVDKEFEDEYGHQVKQLATDIQQAVDE